MANYKKFITLLLIFSVYMMPFNTQAAGFGPWTITNTVAQGASTILTGSKEIILNGAKKIATGTAKITPAASQVSKVLARGAAGYALSFAVQQLLGSVDWVLDPANNQIKYSDKPRKPYFLGVPGSDLYGEGKTREEACQMYAVSYNKKHGGGSTLYYYSTVGIQGNVTATSPYWCYLNKMVYSTVYDNAVRVNGNINVKELGNTEGEVKTYPLPAIADFLINEAEQGNTTAQQATTAAAADIINEAENDNVKARPIINQLENTQSIPTDQTAKGDAVPKESENTGDPTAQPKPQDITLDFPIFCDWAPSICQAAKEVIKLPITLTDWWDSATTSISESWIWAKSRYDAAVTSISDFFKDESNTDTEFEFNDPTQITDTSISFSNQCPAPITLADFSYHGITQKWEMNFSPWCDVISTFIKPIAIAMASFSAVLIVSGVRENG